MAHNPLHRITSQGGKCYALKTSLFPADVDELLSLDANLELDDSVYDQPGDFYLLWLTTGTVLCQADHALNVLPTNEEGDIESVGLPNCFIQLNNLTIMDPDGIAALLAGFNIKEDSTKITLYGSSTSIPSTYGVVFIGEQPDGKPFIFMLYKVRAEGPWTAQVGAGEQAQGQFTLKGKIVPERDKGDRVFRIDRLK